MLVYAVHCPGTYLQRVRVKISKLKPQCTVLSGHKAQPPGVMQQCFLHLPVSVGPQLASLSCQWQ